MSARTCLDCKHWWWYPGEPEYSECTPGTDASMHCSKGHWRLGMFDDNRGDVRQKLKRAERCKDFEQDAT